MTDYTRKWGQGQGHGKGQGQVRGPKPGTAGKNKKNKNNDMFLLSESPSISAATVSSASIRSPESTDEEEEEEEEEEDDDDDEGYLIGPSMSRHSFASSSYNMSEDGGGSTYNMFIPYRPNHQHNMSSSNNNINMNISPISKSPWSCHMSSTAGGQQFSSSDMDMDMDYDDYFGLSVPPNNTNNNNSNNNNMKSKMKMNISYDHIDPDENFALSCYDMNNNSCSSTSPSNNRLMGSLVREEGHIYSLAASGEYLYTGSDSKNIRVWKNQREYSGFKANSGLVKSIVISGGNRIFTGHQDGKIRVWKVSSKNPAVHKRIATLPTLKAYIKSSMKPSSYVEANRKSQRNKPWITHNDAISSLSLSDDQTMLYSASWDRTVKVWLVSTFKCLESISAHDDAVNAVVSGFDGFVFTGSADGTVKVWRREHQGKGTKHHFNQILLKQECAVTALSMDPTSTILYAGMSDGVVHYWERGNLTSPNGQLKGHKLAVLCLATAGTLVFSGSADMNILVWIRSRNDCKLYNDNNNIHAQTTTSTVDHSFLSMLTGHNGPVKCLAVARDLRDDQPLRPVTTRSWILYSGSLDKSVKMWRICEEEDQYHPQPLLPNGVEVIIDSSSNNSNINSRRPSSSNSMDNYRR